MAILISPYAPHICEELWERLGYTTSIEFEKFPEFKAEYLVEDEVEYPVSFNGKMRYKLALPADLDTKTIEEKVMAEEKTILYLEGKTPKKVIIVPKKIINIVC